MAAVAERDAGGVFATAEQDFLAVFLRLVGKGNDARALVRAVAPGLALRPPAGAPEVPLALLKLSVVRLVPGDDGFLDCFTHRTLKITAIDCLLVSSREPGLQCFS